MNKLMKPETNKEVLEAALSFDDATPHLSSKFLNEALRDAQKLHRLLATHNPTKG